ncbi:MAG: hypothetical protein IMW93_09575 [Thermoanaerobacteraceae bacterium]|nr:hypothetical protein [Thermoanaerobacteraceae bacterium]
MEVEAFIPGGLLVELDNDTLNRALLQARDKTLESLSVNVSPGNITVSGRLAEERIAFRMEGTFTATGGMVYFRPRTMLVENNPVDEQILAYLFTRQSLSWDAGRQFPALKIRDIKNGPGRLTITLAR